VIDRTYRCDLCRGARNLEDLTPLHWDHEGLREANGQERADCEHHLCHECRRAIAGFRPLTKEGAKP
jgi:hypothetical protein